MSGYPVATLSQPYGWGRGQQQPVRLADPGAGNIATLKLDGFYFHRLLSLVFTLTTSATVANRYVTVEYQGGDGKAMFVAGAGTVVLAGSTQRFAFALGRGESEWAANTDVLSPLVPAFMEGGNSLVINVAGIQAGDTLTSIRGIIEQFPTAEAAVPGAAE